MWAGATHSADANATTASIRNAGGMVHRELADIPEVGRFSVVADPQGDVHAAVPTGRIAPLSRNAPAISAGTVSCRRLAERARLLRVAVRLGKGEPMDMGEMGTYQLFTVDGELVGAMFNKPSEVPFPVWLFYFNVESIDAARQRVIDNGGKIMLEPMEVPDGWVLQGTDPQGAWFALSAPKR